MVVPSDKAERIPIDFLRNVGSNWLSVRKEDEKAFVKFCEAHVSSDTVKGMGIAIFIMYNYIYIMSFMNNKHKFFMIALWLFSLCVRNPVALFMMYYSRKMQEGTTSKFLHAFTPYYPIVMNMTSIFTTFNVGLYLLARVSNGHCDSLDQHHMWACDSERESRAIPQEMVVMLMLLPVMYAIAFKSIKMSFVFISWFATVAFIFIAICIANATQSIPTLIIYIIISFPILYEVRRQNIILFLMAKRQQGLLETNQKLSEEAHNELRFMIANMAHDLKTPLSSFMNGVETLSSMTDELNNPPKVAGSEGGGVCPLAEAAAACSHVKDVQASMRENIKNLFNVNMFMTMTVNRCIDYMKASKGIKLEPRLETINLQEVLSMPLNCMRDLQTRLAISQKRIPESVSSHVITDQQWFQENIFCLVSNAVKYSSQGQITVSLSLALPGHPNIVAAIERKATLAAQPQAQLCTRSGSGSDKNAPNSVTQERYTFLDNLARSTKYSDLSASEEDLEAGNESPSRIKRHSPLSFYKHRARNKVGVADSDSPTGAHGPRFEIKTAGVSPQFTSEPSKKELAAAERAFLMVEVEDTGIGLSEEVRNSLFSPFKQAQRRAGGTGLGLYSLAKRVDALGGHYGVTSRRDGKQGSIFWFAIPYKPDEAPGLTSQRSTSISLSLSIKGSDSQSSRIAHNKSPVQAAGVTRASLTAATAAATLTAAMPINEEDEVGLSGKKAEAESDKGVESTPSASAAVTNTTVTPTPPSPPKDGKRRVLLVDDSLPILKMTTKLLQRHGFEVDQDVNGADALMRLEQRRRETGDDSYYDVVLLDLNMPVMDGLETTKRLRDAERVLNSFSGSAREGASEKPHHQKVFAFSANSDRETMKEAMEAGADDFISKPFSIQTFQEKVESWLKSSL